MYDGPRGSAVVPEDSSNTIQVKYYAYSGQRPRRSDRRLSNPVRNTERLPPLIRIKSIYGLACHIRIFADSEAELHDLGQRSFEIQNGADLIVAAKAGDLVH